MSKTRDAFCPYIVINDTHLSGQVVGVGSLRHTYPLVQQYLCRMLQLEAVSSTVDMWSYPMMYGTVNPNPIAL